MAQRQCEDCKETFTYTPPANYPDKRKYCDSCSAKRKASYEAAKSGKVSQDAPMKQITQSVTEARHDVVISRTEKPHSYETGKVGNRHKIYYGTIAELKEHFEALKEAGFIEEEPEFEKQKF